MSKKFYIFPLSDLHLGSKQCDIQFFHKWRNIFEKAPENKCIYLLGDLLEFPTTRLDAYSSSISTHDALERLVNLLKPYKEYIRYCVTGNHEARTTRDFNFDITKTLAHRLDVPYSRSDFFDTLTINDKKLIVYGKHGTRISKNSMLSMKNFIYDMADVEADLHLQGHNHYCEFVSKFQRGADGGKRKYYGFSGMFLGYDGYARNKGLAMVQPAFIDIKQSVKDIALIGTHVFKFVINENSVTYMSDTTLSTDVYSSTKYAQEIETVTGVSDGFYVNFNLEYVKEMLKFEKISNVLELRLSPKVLIYKFQDDVSGVAVKGMIAPRLEEV